MLAHTRNRWLLLLLLIVVAAGLFFVLRRWLNGPLPTVPITQEYPVIAPEIENLAQAEELTAGKPVPSVEAIVSLPVREKPDHVYGSASAEISMVMFGNLSNQYVALLAPSLKQIVDDSGGKVNWIFRQFPLDAGADMLAAEATECVAESGGNDAFWTYLNALLVSRNFARENLLALAGQTPDTNVADVTACLDSHDQQDYVFLDAQAAQLDASLTVSPSFIFVNNTTNVTRIVEGLNPPFYLKEVIAAM